MCCDVLVMKYPLFGVQPLPFGSHVRFLHQLGQQDQVCTQAAHADYCVDIQVLPQVHRDALGDKMELGLRLVTLIRSVWALGLNNADQLIAKPVER